MKSTTTTKTVQVLAIYTFKKNANRVCFSVLSSNGTDKYHTCFDNGHESCTCPARGECYHRKQLRTRAAAIIAAKQQGTTPAAQPVKRIDVVSEALTIVEQAQRRYTITDVNDAWYGLTDEQINTAKVNWNMALQPF